MLDANSRMSDKTKEEKSEANAILLVQVGESYWLVEGDEHLAVLLSAEQSYPTPVYCVRFASMFELSSLPGGGMDIADLWAIHTGIIDRLKTENQLVLVEYSHSS
nr:hypothetical protein [uncultured Cohaesibacter sp.]